MLYVSDCCFCIDLRSGALILAWITTLLTFFGFNSAYLAFEKAMGQQVISADTQEDKFYNVLLALFACSSFFIIFVANVLLILGVIMRKAHLVKVWLVVTLLQIIGGSVLSVHFIRNLWWSPENFMRAVCATALSIGK